MSIIERQQGGQPAGAKEGERGIGGVGTGGLEAADHIVL